MFVLDLINENQPLSNPIHHERISDTNQNVFQAMIRHFRLGSKNEQISNSFAKIVMDLLKSHFYDEIIAVDFSPNCGFMAKIVAWWCNTDFWL